MSTDKKLLDRRATDEGVFKFKVADVVELRTNTLFDEEGVPVGGDGGIIGCDAVVVEPDDNMTQVLVRWEDQDKEILGCPTNKLLLLQRMTSKTANELRDWRQMFAAYCALPMKPDGLWPNNWSQDVAMIAHALQPRSAAPDGEKPEFGICEKCGGEFQDHWAQNGGCPPASSATSGAVERLRLSLRNFGADVFENFFGDGADIGDVDGATLQDMAVDAGLLRTFTIESDDGCGEVCNCREYGATAGDTCYRTTFVPKTLDAALANDPAQQQRQPQGELGKGANIEQG